uniref:Uncharacterized protein n=1 Tax=Solanum lycopersicum TaxID=4081 RepID=A0A3Q7GFJ9_SOLLC
MAACSSKGGCPSDYVALSAALLSMILLIKDGKDQTLEYEARLASFLINQFDEGVKKVDI